MANRWCPNCVALSEERDELTERIAAMETTMENDHAHERKAWLKVEAQAERIATLEREKARRCCCTQ